VCVCVCVCALEGALWLAEERRACGGFEGVGLQWEAGDCGVSFGEGRVTVRLRLEVLSSWGTAFSEILGFNFFARLPSFIRPSGKKIKAKAAQEYLLPPTLKKREKQKEAKCLPRSSSR